MKWRYEVKGGGEGGDEWDVGMMGVMTKPQRDKWRMKGMALRGEDEGRSPERGGCMTREDDRLRGLQWGYWTLSVWLGV